MDQGNPSGDQAHKGRFIRHGIARDQLLVESGEGIGGDTGAAEEGGARDGYGCIEEWKEVSCDCSFDH